MKLWLDDIRTPPDASWIWAKTFEHGRSVLRNQVEVASFDHDLGNKKADGSELSGYDLVLWLVGMETFWPTKTLAVHSANHVGVKNMCGVIERYGPYDTKEFIRYDNTLYDAWLYSKED